MTDRQRRGAAWGGVPTDPTRRLFLAVPLVALAAAVSCRRYREDLDYSYRVMQTWSLEDVSGGRVVQFQTVFWEPADSVFLRRMIVDDRVAAARRVLEIGTGTGLLAILCQQHEAASVVATDINPAAVANARYNAARLDAERNLEVRQVEADNPGAFAVVDKTETFDLIISNPPWEDEVVEKPAEYALYDPGYRLMDSLLDGLPQHLAPGGRCLLVYGHVPAIRRLREQAERRGYAFKILDDRSLDELPTDFLPGMLIEIKVPLDAGGQRRSSEADQQPADGDE